MKGLRDDGQESHLFRGRFSLDVAKTTGTGTATGAVGGRR